MTLRLWRVILTLALLLTAVSAMAQTSDELKQKYEPLGNDSFLVRPKIILTVTFGENGQAKKMQIEPQKVSTSNRFYPEVMPQKLVDEILDELVPPSKRGEGGLSGMLNSSCNAVVFTCYENVEIDISFTCGGVTSAAIEWKKSHVGRVKVEIDK